VCHLNPAWKTDISYKSPLNTEWTFLELSWLRDFVIDQYSQDPENAEMQRKYSYSITTENKIITTIINNI